MMRQFRRDGLADRQPGARPFVHTRRAVWSRARSDGRDRAPSSTHDGRPRVRGGVARPATRSRRELAIRSALDARLTHGGDRRGDHRPRPVADRRPLAARARSRSPRSTWPPRSRPGCCRSAGGPPGRASARAGYRVLLATPTGEHHMLALRMVGDLLREAGCQVVMLGPDVPAEALARRRAPRAARGLQLDRPRRRRLHADHDPRGPARVPHRRVRDRRARDQLAPALASRDQRLREGLGRGRGRRRRRQAAEFN